jgi:poly(A) polymerase
MTSASLPRLPASLSTIGARLNAFFAAAGVDAYATGGLVRDLLLLKTSVSDLDISVTSDPLELGPRLAEVLDGTCFPLDEERRHARLLIRGTPYHIDLMPVRGTIEEDLALRDFTIDAMAVPIAALRSRRTQVIDPTGGARDLAARLVRLVSDQALTDDPLRLLRGVRIAGQIGFEVEPETAAMISRAAPLVTQAAPERQRDELFHILSSDRAGWGLRELDRLDLLARVFPELEVTREVEQPVQHHWNVFRHLIEAVSALDWMLLDAEPEAQPNSVFWRELWSGLAWWPDARAFLDVQLSPGYSRRGVLKLAALLHDIGKPETRTVEPGGRIRFFGHSDVGAHMAGKLLRRLRFPAKVVNHVRAMIDAHLRPLQMAQRGVPSRRAIARFFRDTSGAGIDTLFLSLSDHLATAGPRAGIDGWRRHIAIVAYLLAAHLEGPVVSGPHKIIAGEDLMDEFGLEPGPLIGELLDAVREAHEAGEVVTKEGALELARRELERKGEKR